jgi:glycerol-1-phosphate dehydrogenase [NAD(P)+]
MLDLSNIGISQMVNISFECSCGKEHSVKIKKICISNNVTTDIINILSQYKSDKIFLMADNNTYLISGKNIEDKLKKEHLNLKQFVFQTRNHLIPDEKALGRLLIEIEEDTTLIIAVGSGTLNDLARILSYKLKIPYIIVGTAPSMDGYASSVSPLIIDGFKKTFEAIYPMAILADLKAMKKAPKEMITAGFGDIIGKYIALTDWKLSKTINNEFYCENVVNLINNAIEKCTYNIDGILNRETSSIQSLIEGLILSGIAIGLVGNSRPASGAEHILAHYWEMNFLANGKIAPLHGNLVGVGTVVVLKLYELIKKEANIVIDIPNYETIKVLLDKIGLPVNPKDLGISKQDFQKSIIHAKEIRPRYTIFNLAERLGLLNDAACQLTKIFYD